MKREPTMFDLEEFRALRTEIDLRIKLQNVSLLVLCVLFSTFSIFVIVMPVRAFEAALAFVLAAGMISLFWIHHGARTLQIRTYLTCRIEPALRADGGWEAWHARHRIKGVFGSRWFISTKGVLVGAQLIIILEALLLAPAATGSTRALCSLAIVAMVATAALLKKPRLSPDAYTTVASDTDVRSNAP